VQTALFKRARQGKMHRTLRFCAENQHNRPWHGIRFVCTVQEHRDTESLHDNQ
jgi:hypothetical protein